MLSIIGYPELVDTSSSSAYSIEMAYSIPRVIMGILALIDTFLIYKIVQFRHGNKVAFIASILFAVMPLTWLTRRILLDSIMLPFILSSILFAVYYNKKTKIERTSTHRTAQDKNENKLSNANVILILISGIFLGLAIFTKISAITFIPLVAYLIFTGSGGSDWIRRISISKVKRLFSSFVEFRPRNNNIKIKYRNLKALLLWLIPVILIPTIWPVYSIFAGEFDDWRNDLSWQEGRGGQGMKSLVNWIFNLDPVLVILGLSGLFFAAVKRDYFIFLWIIPFLIYIEFSGWVLVFHYIMLLPGLCISSAALLGRLTEVRIVKNKKKSLPTISDYFGPSEANSGTGLNNPMTKKNSFFPSIRTASSTTKLAVILVTGIVIFGLAVTSVLITADINSTWFEVIAFITQILPEKDMDDQKVTIFLHRNVRDIMWIPKYVFDKDYEYRINDAKIMSWEAPIETERVIMLVETRLMGDIDSGSTEKGVLALKTLYNSTEPIKTFEEKRNFYEFLIPPFDNNMRENRGIGKTSEIRTNY